MTIPVTRFMERCENLKDHKRKSRPDTKDDMYMICVQNLSALSKHKSVEKKCHQVLNAFLSVSMTFSSRL